MSDRSIKDKYFQGQGQVIKDKNDLVKFVSLKTDKLTSALYLITNSLNDNEPLKWRLRKLSLKLLSVISAWSNQSGVQVPVVSEMFFRILEELTTLLNLGRSQAAVSSMNLEVLKNEYLNLAQQLRGQTPFLALPEAPLDPGLLPREESKKGDFVELKREVLMFSQSPKKEQGQNQKNDDRQSAIVQAMTGKDWLSIKEIAQALPTVSTKTVQRELNALLAKGRVKREGDRRWSRYILDEASS